MTHLARNACPETTLRIWRLAIMLAVVAAGSPATPQRIDKQAPDPGRLPTLEHTCLITNNVKRLVSFYEPILALKAKWSGEAYAEFRTGVRVLAIFAADSQEGYIAGSAQAAKNSSMILEFRVADVDREYGRLKSLVDVWVKPPTTQPWGTRSVYFRDPDGNLVDFYTPAKSR
jgi:catechol 2,3-dioxygenase-like lactoylglutathione lyase family enzyme